MADFWGGDVSFEPTKLIVTADSGLDGSNLGALCLPDYAVHTASLAVLHNLNLSCLVRRTCKTYADLVYPPSTIRIFSNNGIEWMPLLLKYDCGLLVSPHWAHYGSHSSSPDARRKTSSCRHHQC